MKKVALIVTCLSFSSLISCSTLQHMLGSEQKTDASGLASSPRGDGADVIDPYSLDTKADSQQAASGEDNSNMNMDSLSLDTPQQSSSASSELQTEVQMDQAPMEHTPVAEAPAMDVAPQSEMADASHEEVAVSAPIETPSIEVFDNQSIAQEQQRAFSSPRKHSAKIEKKSSKKLAKFEKAKKDKKSKKSAIAKKETKKSKLIAKKSLKKEKLAKGSKAKKGMIAKSSKSKKEKVVKSSKSSKSKIVSSKTNKKGKKDRKVASSK
jgi:hypothetical protein